MKDLALAIEEIKKMQSSRPPIEYTGPDSVYLYGEYTLEQLETVVKYMKDTVRELNGTV